MNSQNYYNRYNNHSNVGTLARCHIFSSIPRQGPASSATIEPPDASFQNRSAGKESPLETIWSPSSWYQDVTAGTETGRSCAMAHCRREVQVEEVHVTEKRPELKVCVSLKFHHKVLRKALRQDHHQGPLGKKYMDNSNYSNKPNSCNTND